MKRRIKRISIGAVGGVLLLVGIVAIPYPGPGWLIVFAALAILATEFPWAERALHVGRRKYDEWNAWIKQQNPFVRSITFIGTAIVVALSLWMLNAYGYTSDLLGLGWDWIRSPLPWFY